MSAKEEGQLGAFSVSLGSQHLALKSLLVKSNN